MINYCDNNNISINHSRNTTSSNLSQNMIKDKVVNSNYNNSINTNFSLSFNTKHNLNHYHNNNNNSNLNFGISNNNLDIFDQTRNKYSMKFFEKLNLNNNKNSKGIKVTNVNEITNSLNKNKFNIHKDIIQFYQKDKNYLKNNENILMNKITKNILSPGNHIETKNTNLSSSYNNMKNIDSLIDKSNENNNKGKGRNIIGNDYNTINFERKISQNIIKSKLSKEKIGKIDRNSSNYESKNKSQKHKNNYNLLSSPLNKKKNINASSQNQVDQNNIKNKTSIIFTKKNDINKNNYYPISYEIDKDKNNENDIIIDSKKLSIIDIPAPISNNNLSNNKLDIINTFKNNPNLTIKEKALYILIKSPIVPLTSQFILSRSTDNLKKIILKKDVLLNYDLYLKNKIHYYEEKQILHSEKIKSIFTPTKIAEITLNFITSENEKQFNSNYILLLNNKDDYNYTYYNSYIKIIYYIINESFEEDNKKEIKESILLIHLYEIIKKKGYNNIKDYLYYLYISNNNKKENIFMNNIDKINKIINDKVPKLFSFDESLKTCRFIIYSIYLIKEIVQFANMIKKTVKIKTQENKLIKKMKDILDKFDNKFLI